MQESQAVPVRFWSKANPTAQAARTCQHADSIGQLDDREGPFRRFTVSASQAGTLILHLISRRPFRVWRDQTLVMDEPLYWRHYNVQSHSALLLAVEQGDVDFLLEVGRRPRHPEHVDLNCPSRNRPRLMRQLMQAFPDSMELTAELVTGVSDVNASLRFTATQYRSDGVTYQMSLVRQIGPTLEPPTTERRVPLLPRTGDMTFASSVLPTTVVDHTRNEDQAGGLRRIYAPVAHDKDAPPLRQIGQDDRLQPWHGVTGQITLHVAAGSSAVPVAMPVFESTGRLAPRREHHHYDWPSEAQLMQAVPQPVLPPSLASLGRLYQQAWSMFLKLVVNPPPESGAIGSYISTGAGFGLMQFVWDSSFTTMCMAYAWRVMNVHANLDNLYSRQFDGGYLHREISWEDGLPSLFEPDFGPNPPIASLAEWQVARISGNLLRLKRVYPLLLAQHQWLRANRRLPDGTYWTTGLANGLDNSPSLGDGYPCLTAQMAHDAQTLAAIALLLGNADDARMLTDHHQQCADALNQHLWSDTQRIYATSLPGGGHNPNKVVTAFWPLWAGIVPPQRVDALAEHLLDPGSFWRHHPIPSLAADSPQYRTGGDYWLGSTWAPTNYAAIKGFARAGRHDLARRTTLRHLQCMSEVLTETGEIWENYAPDASARGSWSGSPYCWSALGPIALLLEVLIGVEPDAIARRIRWTVPDEPGLGVRNYPLGDATVSLIRSTADDGRRLEIQTDRAITVEIIHDGKTNDLACNPGRTEHLLAE